MSLQVWIVQRLQGEADPRCHEQISTSFSSFTIDRLLSERAVTSSAEDETRIRR
jgi:hypothetical protein